MKFKRIDVIGKEIQLKVGQREKFQTNLGAVLTLVLTLCGVIAIWYFGKDIIEKTNPTFLASEVRHSPWPYFMVNNSNFFLGMRIEDDDGRYVDDNRFFELIFEYHYYIQNKTTAEMELIHFEKRNLVKCNSSHIDNLFISQKEVESFYCIDLRDYYFGGDWISEKLGFLSFFIQKCNKSTEKKYNLTCATEKEIEDNYMNKLYVGLMKFDNLINPKNLSYPFKADLQYSFQSLSSDIRKQNFIYYSTAILKTDRDPIFSNYDELNSTQINRNILDFQDLATDNRVFELNIYLDNKIYRYERYYVKVQVIAATVGGIMNVIFYIIKFIYSFYIENHFQYFLLNRLIKFENASDSEDLIDIKDNNKLQYEINKLEAKFPETSGFSPPPNIRSITRPVSIIFEHGEKQDANSDIPRKDTHPSCLNSKLRQLINVRKKNGQYYPISECDVCCFQCRRQCVKKNSLRIKNQLIMLANNEIEKKFNFLETIKFIDQVSVLKQIILNEEQTFMLDNKDKLLINNTLTVEDSEELINLLKKDKEKKLIEYLNMKKLTNKLSEVDLLLYNNLNDEIRSKVQETVNIEI